MRFRVAPSRSGAVKTSPRAAKTARSPFGLKLEVLDLLLRAETRDGRVATPSSGTKIDEARVGLRLHVEHLQLAVQLVDDAGHAVGARPADVPRRPGVSCVSASVFES